MESSQQVLESLASQLQSLSSEMNALKLAVDSRKTDRTMEEDVEPDVEEESTFADEIQWSTELGTSNAEASKPAALSLSSLLTAPPPHWSKCEGRRRE